MAAENETEVQKQMRDINCDNLVKYNDQFNKGNATYLSMEYINGTELAEAEPQNINQVLDWSIQIFEGLKALHDKNIAHRDIKPENILISANNQIKICDFGIAKDANLTKTRCGTRVMNDGA